MPLMRDACIPGHDIEYHLLRIESLKNGILIGKPFLKVNTMFFNNAGYASSLFYPDFLLYLPAILRVLGFSIPMSYNLFIVFCIVMCYISVYYCTKLIINNKYGAVTASIIYTLCQYHIDNIYVRAAVGEISAFIFIPLIFYGIYDVLYKNFQKPWIMILGFIGIMLSHTITLLLCIFLYMILFGFHLKIFLKNSVLLYKLILSAIIVLSLTAFYWLPVIEQIANDTFRFSTPWILPSKCVLNIKTLLSNNFKGIGLFVFLLCFSRFFILKTTNKCTLIKFADKCLFIGILFVLLTTNLFPWEKFDNYLSVIQFPWRLHIISLFCLSMAISIYFTFLFYNNKNKLYGLYIIVFSMCISTLITFSRTDISYVALKDNYYYNPINTSKVQAGEWLPLSVTDTDLVLADSNKVITDSGRTLPFIREKNCVFVDCTNIENNKSLNYYYIDVPFIYYKGYSAYLLSENEGTIKLKVSGNGNNGFCRVKIPNNCKGTILVKYDGTTIQNLSYVISLSTMLSLLVFYTIKNNSRLLYQPKICNL